MTNARPTHRSHRFPAARCAAATSLVLAPVATAKPKLDDVLSSVRASMNESPTADLPTAAEVIGSGVWPWIVALVALALLAIAGRSLFRRWRNARAGRAPRALHSPRKLLAELARATGIAPRALKRAAPVARAAGLSSPLVALLCPSQLRRLAEHARTPAQRAAVAELARQVLAARGA